VRNLTRGLLFALAILAVAASGSWAGVPCAGASSVSVSPDSAAVGDTVDIYVTVRDCYGQPLADRVCSFYTDRGGQDVIIGSPQVTDISGSAHASVTTSIPGFSEAYVSSEGVELGPSDAIKWTGEGLGEPVLRVGAWMNPEPWHDWIGGAGGSTPIEFHVSDPLGVIDSVQFYYSTDGGGSWNYIATDLDGTDDYENTDGPIYAGGDGWSASLDHDEIQTEIIALDLKGIAHFAGSTLEAEESVTYLETPPSQVEFTISDWDTIKTEILQLGIFPNGVDIDRVVTFLEEKIDTFSKDIPKIDQRTHSDNHCAPTAAAACLKYFEGQGDAVVTGGLSDDDLVDAIAEKMKTSPSTGTKTANVSAGLKDWIEGHGDGYTVRVYSHNSGFSESDWKRMRDELESCQDVLTKVSWPGGGAHRMTFNSVVNKPLPNGRMLVDWMDPWTADYEYGELDTSTGEIHNLSGAGGGGNGNITQTMIVCPEEPDEEGPDKPGKQVVPGPDPGPIPIPMPPVGPCHWHFIHIIVIDANGFAHHFIIIVKWLPPASVEDRHGKLPVEFELNQGNPNPFSDRTEIRYAVPVETPVTLEIYDVLGKKVRTLVDGLVGPGYHATVWDGRDDHSRAVAPGAYYANMMTSTYGRSCKIILLR
jgi:hypothetical protein